MESWDLVVIGGGAAGYFSALSCAEANSAARILILEATGKVLTKVKVSGGGRCNVTHNQFDAKQLIKNYPRGQKELLGPFHQFQPSDTIDWFEKHDVKLKAEADGRVFPTTNDSQTILNCFQSTAEKLGIQVRKNSLVQKISKHEVNFEIAIRSAQPIQARFVLLATGSMPFGVTLAKSLGHKLISPIPSLFTFQINHPLLSGLPGISFPMVDISLRINREIGEAAPSINNMNGPCLITHWGLSGPAVLKLSAFAARELFACGYNASLIVNWIAPLNFDDVIEKLNSLKKQNPKKKIHNENPFLIVKRFWTAILKECNLDDNQIIGDMTKKQFQLIAKNLTQTELTLIGKGEFKEEFVTAGGVSREEIDFRKMESKIVPGLFFAGEIIDIDGITGGFNFQNAWTGGFIAGNAIAKLTF